MKIVNEAQKDHKSRKIIFHQINKLLGICMIYPILTICIHISNKRVYEMYLHESKRLTGIHVYLLDLN